MSKAKHPYHLVHPSPWPIFASLAALTTTFGSVMYFHGHHGGGSLTTFGIACLVYAFAIWWRDVVREASFQGDHTTAVEQGLRYGVVLFIVSEFMFFFAFFWAFFHSSLSPAIEIGGVWPPKGIQVINPWEVPFINTLILLTSGASITWAHHALLTSDSALQLHHAGEKTGSCHARTQVIYGLVVTILLALVFTALQAMEYVEAGFTLSDSVYGSTFYMATGFHGLHVIIGTIFLIVCLARAYAHHFSKSHHFGFEAAAWYWHFVDVVWLFLFVSVYWWGGI